MDFLSSFGLTLNEIGSLVILTIVLLIGLVALRVILKMTGAVLRLGCFLIIFIVGAGFLLTLLN